MSTKKEQAAMEAAMEAAIAVLSEKLSTGEEENWKIEISSTDRDLKLEDWVMTGDPD